jgi:hypothetical protein
MLDDYFCELCKVRVAEQLYTDRVHPDAMRVLAMAIFSVFIFGFAVGPYTIWRGSQVNRALDRANWLRGQWHVRAAYVLAGFGTALGIVSLIARFATDGGG